MGHDELKEGREKRAEIAAVIKATVKGTRSWKCANAGRNADVAEPKPSGANEQSMKAATIC
jgi:hypothetical protein